MSHTHRYYQTSVTNCLDCDVVTEISYACIPPCPETKTKTLPCKCDPNAKPTHKRPSRWGW